MHPISVLELTKNGVDESSMSHRTYMDLSGIPIAMFHRLIMMMSTNAARHRKQVVTQNSGRNFHLLIVDWKSMIPSAPKIEATMEEYL